MNRSTGAPINDEASWFEMVLQKTKLSEMCDNMSRHVLLQKQYKSSFINKKGDYFRKFSNYVLSQANLCVQNTLNV